MTNTLLFIGSGILLIMVAAILFIIINTYRHIGALEKNVGYQYNLVLKIQSMLKNKSATNAVAEHAEMIYQDLLQNLIPILAALDIIPRNTS